MMAHPFSRSCSTRVSNRSASGIDRLAVGSSRIRIRASWAPGNVLPRASQRFYGTATLDSTRVGRDASRIADEVIAHLAGLLGAEVTVTLEIDANIPAGAPDNVVRTVTENSRTLKFKSQGFERE